MADSQRADEDHRGGDRWPVNSTLPRVKPDQFGAGSGDPGSATGPAPARRSASLPTPRPRPARGRGRPDGAPDLASSAPPGRLRRPSAPARAGGNARSGAPRRGIPRRRDGAYPPQADHGGRRKVLIDERPKGREVDRGSPRRDSYSARSGWPGRAHPHAVCGRGTRPRRGAPRGPRSPPRPRAEEPGPVSGCAFVPRRVRARQRVRSHRRGPRGHRTLPGESGSLRRPPPSREGEDTRRNPGDRPPA